MEALTHLALIWLGTFVAVMIARATRLTPVVYYLGIGAIFVNIGWLPEESGEFIRGLSEVGIIVIMFALGFEENAATFLRSIKQSWGIAFFGALAPFLIGYGVATFFWGEPNISLMCGLAMTATAVSLTMVSLRSEGLHNSPVATRIMTSAVLDDIAALALLAVVVSVVTGDDAGGGVDLMITGVIIGKAVLFFVIISIIGAWIFPKDPKGLAGRIPFLNMFGLRQVLRFDRGQHATLLVLLLALTTALVGHYFGFHPAVGAYMAGLILREEYFHPGTEDGSYDDTKRIIDNVAFCWIGPVFFVELGTKILFDWDLLVSIIPMAVTMTVGLLIGQVVSAGLAARYTGGMKKAASVMIGLGMLGRAELAFVVLDIAYVQHEILSREAFYTLMITCFFLNIAVPVSIHLWKPYYLKERELEQQEAEEPETGTPA